MMNFLFLETEELRITEFTQVVKKHSRNQSIPLCRLSILSHLNDFEDIQTKFHLRESHVLLLSTNLEEIKYKNIIQWAKSINPNILIILLAYSQNYLNRFLNASYCPNGVLFYPLNENELITTLNYLDNQINDQISKLSKQSFKIKLHGEILNFTTDELYFFESKGNKISMKTSGQVIEFYSNFEEVLKHLPNNFVRCHKGFIVNLDKVSSISLSKNYITLSDSSNIQISRTYKETLKQLIEVVK